MSNTVFNFWRTRMILGDIAQVKTGLVLTRKKASIETKEQVTYQLLTLNNISEDGSIIQDVFESFTSNERLQEHYFTQKNDILIRLNHPFTAVFIDEKYTSLLIPSYFAVIKVTSKDILPQYLAWYLNSDYIKRELQRQQFGSRIVSTNKQAIKQLPINVPSLNKQQTIIKLYQLYKREQSLYKQLMEEKELLFNEITKKLLGGE